jgi:hypothetical protein
MLNYNINAQGGFHPRRCGSPDAITPEQVLRHHRSSLGRHGGKGSCPLLPSYQPPEFHIHGKGILQSHFKKHFYENRIIQLLMRRLLTLISWHDECCSPKKCTHTGDRYLIIKKITRCPQFPGRALRRGHSHKVRFFRSGTKRINSYPLSGVVKWEIR